MAVTPSASRRLTVRVGLAPARGCSARLTSAIGEGGGDIGAVDTVEWPEMAPDVGEVVKAAHETGVARGTRRPAVP